MPSRFRLVLSSTVGTKLLIGLTGLALIAYLIVHLAGNLLIFGGQDLFNEYAHALVSNPLIIPLEIGLLALFLVHIYKTVRNYLRNQAARPVGYRMKSRAGHTSRKGLASSTMIGSGLLLALFVVIHVRQFKFGSWYGSVTDETIRDLYRTEVETFQEPFWVAFYVVAMAAVGLHLRHGIASALQSLGLDHPLYTRRLTAWGLALAILIAGGFALIPLWVYFTH
jgi:succinate dehydrogenase / fumarate reductase, cytochrome b subunit